MNTKKYSAIKYDSNKYTPKEIMQMLSVKRIVEVAEELNISHQRVSKIVSREKELGTYPELVQKINEAKLQRRRAGILKADKYNSHKNGEKTNLLEETKPRFCLNCNERIVRGTRLGKYLEDTTHFLNRKYCNVKCFREFQKKNKKK